MVTDYRDGSASCSAARIFGIFLLLPLSGVEPAVINRTLIQLEVEYNWFVGS